ncbi:cache domain-containing protein [Enterovibrio sp. Hal110]
MRALSIRQRLSLIIVISVLSLISVTIVSLMLKHENMLDERKNQIQVLVETAETLVTKLHQQALAGDISMEEAKQRAISALDAMRYGDNGYFMIYDMNSIMVHHPITASLIGRDLTLSSGRQWCLHHS